MANLLKKIITPVQVEKNIYYKQKSYYLLILYKYKKPSLKRERYLIVKFFNRKK